MMIEKDVLETGMQQYIQRKNPGLFDYTNRLEELSQSEPPLYQLDKRIDWEMFRKDLEELVSKKAAGAGGRPRHDVVVMFKVLVLQRYTQRGHNLSFLKLPN